MHKTQALSIKHLVIGCLEGVFAMGQASRARALTHTVTVAIRSHACARARAGARAPEVYVLISRVTDPQNLMLTGLPPKDLWEDISQLWLRSGINIDDAWKRACSVTNEWVYEPGPGPLRSRIRQRIMHERSIPLKNRSG